MSNNSEHCCLSCGTDISNKRKDAKYCSDRCRMRYQRDQKRNSLIEDLAEVFTQLPNHSVQCIDDWMLLQFYDATSGKTQIWSRTDLKTKSIGHLERLVKDKKWLLSAEIVKQLWG